MRVSKIHGHDIYFPAGRLRYSSRLTNTGLDNPDHEGSQGYNNIKLSSNYMPLHVMEAPIRHHNSSYMSTAQKVIGKNTRESSTVGLHEQMDQSQRCRDQLQEST